MIRLIAAALALGAGVAVVILVVLGTRTPGVPAGTGGGSGGAARATSYCDATPAPGFGRPPDTVHRGRYVNAVYGYAVTIPPGLTGHTSAAGAPRGFGTVLSSKPSAFLRVDAGYDALYDITAAGVHTRDSMDVRLFDTLVQERRENYSLAGVEGGRYRMTVRCAGGARTYVYDDVIVVRNREIYRLDLQSVPERLAADERVLEAMLQSWSWVPLSP